MKTSFSLLLVSTILFSTGLIGLADADFYTTTTNLWYQGHKHEVYTNALERLSVNTNDMAGLLLTLEYDIEFLRVDSISNSAARVLNQGATVTNENFLAVYPELAEDIHVVLSLMVEQPMMEDERTREATKGNIPGKRLAYESMLEALQKDNLIPELQ